MLTLILNRDSVPVILPGNAVPTTLKVTNSRHFASEVFGKFSGDRLAAAHQWQGRQARGQPPGAGASVRLRNRRAADKSAGRLASRFLRRVEFLLFSCDD